MAGQHGGFSLISQQMAFEMEALKTARYNAAQAISNGNLELLQLAVSQLCDLAMLEQIAIPGTKPSPNGFRLDQFRANMNYFNYFSNYISKELGKKWAQLRLKYGTQAFGVGQVGGGSNNSNGMLSPAPPIKKPKWMQAQDAMREGSA